MGTIAVLLAAAFATPPEIAANLDPCVVVTAKVIEASNEHAEVRRAEPAIDPELREISSHLKKLPYDSFRLRTTTWKAMEYQKESQIQLSERHTLCLTPHERDPSGRIRLTATVQQRSGDVAKAADSGDEKPKVENLMTIRGTVAQGKHVFMQGIRESDDCELIVVVTVTEEGRTTDSTSDERSPAPRTAFR